MGWLIPLLLAQRARSNVPLNGAFSSTGLKLNEASGGIRLVEVAIHGRWGCVKSLETERAGVATVSPWVDNARGLEHSTVVTSGGDGIGLNLDTPCRRFSRGRAGLCSSHLGGAARASWLGVLWKSIMYRGGSSALPSTSGRNSIPCNQRHMIS
ncbi:hypothetical protein RRG08_058473 [Elysia crispata]|uniref:Uncharacterized protein n=1 Tax=Elysia crispata TaxID=231223 RepID=A0AAE0Y6B6_9GAST|nr:hypothetical protein RRG08_058473 [Elysia crispata]